MDGQHRELMDTDAAWALWGMRDPYYGVLTHAKFRATAMTPEAKQEFFASGRSDCARVLAMCRQCIRREDYTPQRILDFGCGVGRLLLPFAEIAKSVVGVDVSPSMLVEAERNCAHAGIHNVILSRADDLLCGIEGQYDLVHSSMVLQHINTNRGKRIFDALLSRVAPNGCAAIHVTFAWDAFPESFGQVPEAPPPVKLSGLGWLRSQVGNLIRKHRAQAVPTTVAIEPDVDPEMQMNFYNLSELLFMVQSRAGEQANLHFTNHGGALGAYIVCDRARVN